MAFKSPQSNTILTPTDDEIAKKKSEVKALDGELKEKIELVAQIPEPVLGAAEFVDQTPLIDEQNVVINDNKTVLNNQEQIINENEEIIKVQNEQISNNETIILVQKSKIEPEEVILQREKDRQDSEERYNTEFNNRKSLKEFELSEIDSKIKEKNDKLGSLNSKISLKESEITKKDEEKVSIQNEIEKLKPQLMVIAEEYHKSLSKYEKLETTLKNSEQLHKEKLKVQEDKLGSVYQAKENALLVREGEVSKKIDWIEKRSEQLRGVKLELESLYGKPININI